MSPTPVVFDIKPMLGTSTLDTVWPLLAVRFLSALDRHIKYGLALIRVGPVMCQFWANYELSVQVIQYWRSTRLKCSQCRNSSKHVHFFSPPPHKMIFVIFLTVV